MANIKIPRKTFEKEIGKLDEKMKDKIQLFGTPLESVTEEEIEIEIFPNRPDLLSYQGFKRSFLAFLGKKTGLKQYKIKKPEKNYQVKIESSLKNIRPATSCAIVKGLKLDEEKIKEIIDLQEKLHSTMGRRRKKLAIGIYPLDKIKLPIKFKALEPEKIKFIPLESEKEMSALEILEKNSIGKQYSHLLAGKTRFPVFLDSNNLVLSMPPVINSQETGRVKENTKDVFVECSGFNQGSLDACLNIITTSLADMGGTIYQMEIKPKKMITPNLKEKTRRVNLEKVNKIIGTKITEKELKTALEKMGHSYSKGKVQISAWRNDIMHEIDLIEDVAIGYGYEKLTPEIPEISTVGKEDKKETLKRKISQILSGLEFLETSSFHLTTKEDQFLKMGLNEKQIKNPKEVENSKTEYNLLRENLSHKIMKIYSENIDSEYPQKVFEVGCVFGKKEKTNLALATNPGNFTEIKQSLNYLIDMLGLEINYEEPKNNPAHLIPGRVAEVKFKGKTIGHLGEIHPKILKAWRIKMPVAILEISLEEIYEELFPKG